MRHVYRRTDWPGHPGVETAGAVGQHDHHSHVRSRLSSRRSLFMGQSDPVRHRRESAVSRTGTGSHNTGQPKRSHGGTDRRVSHTRRPGRSTGPHSSAGSLPQTTTAGPSLDRLPRLRLQRRHTRPKDRLRDSQSAVAIWLMAVGRRTVRSPDRPSGTTQSGGPACSSATAD